MRQLQLPILPIFRMRRVRMECAEGGGMQARCGCERSAAGAGGVVGMVVAGCLDIAATLSGRRARLRASCGRRTRGGRTAVRPYERGGGVGAKGGSQTAARRRPLCRITSAGGWRQHSMRAGARGDRCGPSSPVKTPHVLSCPVTRLGVMTAVFVVPLQDGTGGGELKTMHHQAWIHHVWLLKGGGWREQTDEPRLGSPACKSFGGQGQAVGSPR